MAEVGRDESRVGSLLAQPRGRGVSERVGRDLLFESSSRCRTADDQAEHAGMQPLAFEPAEDGCVGSGSPCFVKPLELRRERRWKWLPPWLAALTSPHKQRRPPRIEVDVAPIQRDQLGTAEAGRDKRKEDEPIAFDEARPSPDWRVRCLEQSLELVWCEPVGFVLRLAGRVEVAEWIG